MGTKFKFGRKYTSYMSDIREQLEYFSKISRDRNVVIITATQRPTHSPQILLGTTSGLHPTHMGSYIRRTETNKCMILDYMDLI
jgi:hypothetical protein